MWDWDKHLGTLTIYVEKSRTRRQTYRKESRQKNQIGQAGKKNPEAATTLSPKPFRSNLVSHEAWLHFHFCVPEMSLWPLVIPLGLPVISFWKPKNLGLK